MVNECFSGWRKVCSAVPQGWVLGSLHFLMVWNLVFMEKCQNSPQTPLWERSAQVKSRAGMVSCKERGFDCSLLEKFSDLFPRRGVAAPGFPELGFAVLFTLTLKVWVRWHFCCL